MTLPLSLDHLHEEVPGGVLRPEDPDYPEAVTTMAGPGEPELVVQPASPGEVAAAVGFARDHGLPLTVRAGGHSVAGLTRASGGLLLDLRRMRRIEVDPASRLVRIDGGACWGGVAQALAPHSLGLTAGDTAGVGVGGLTLGGGIGWMVRRHGLAIDNLVGAEVVTADGKVVKVSDAEHPELFWALRGGGGTLGVVTRFDFVAQEVSDVVFGNVMFAVDDPMALLGRWRDVQRGADERLTTILTLIPPMGEQPAIARLGLCFAEPGPDADAAVEALLELGVVLSHDVAVRPYAEVLEDVEHPAGMRIAMRNTFLPGLSDAVLANVAAVYAHAPTMVSLRALGGAFSRVPAEATAFAHRSAEAMVAAIRFSPDSGDPTLADIPGWDALAGHGTGSYVNFLSSAGQEEAAASYPAGTAHRLARVKSEYDPANVFDRAIGHRRLTRTPGDGIATDETATAGTRDDTVRRGMA